MKINEEIKDKEIWAVGIFYDFLENQQKVYIHSEKYFNHNGKIFLMVSDHEKEIYKVEPLNNSYKILMAYLKELIHIEYKEYKNHDNY